MAAVAPLLIAALALLGLARSAAGGGGTRTLVLLENTNLKDTHSLFLRSLAGEWRGGWRLEPGRPPSMPLAARGPSHPQMRGIHLSSLKSFSHRQPLKTLCSCR